MYQLGFTLSILRGFCDFHTTFRMSAALRHRWAAPEASFVGWWRRRPPPEAFYVVVVGGAGGLFLPRLEPDHYIPQFDVFSGEWFAA